MPLIIILIEYIRGRGSSDQAFKIDRRLVIKHDYSYTYLIALGLILSGAAGNLWDRLYWHGVRDFIDFYIGKYHWPTFNIADCFILVGIGVFLWLEWKHPHTPAANK